MKEKAVEIIKALAPFLGMVLIWRLVDRALTMGINHACYFAGIASLAGISGYSLKWVLDIWSSKSRIKTNSTKTSDQE